MEFLRIFIGRLPDDIGVEIFDGNVILRYSGGLRRSISPRSDEFGSNFNEFVAISREEEVSPDMGHYSLITCGDW